MRRQPYLALALAYAAMFVVAFSSFANFGNLVRQRVQVLPFVVALLCIPPRRKKQAHTTVDDVSRWQAAS
jgi:hypothetical protein